MNEDIFHSSEKNISEPSLTSEKPVSPEDDSDIVESTQSSAQTIAVPSSDSLISPLLDPISSNEFSARTESANNNLSGVSAFVHSSPTLEDIPKSTSSSDIDGSKATMPATGDQESALTQNENWKAYVSHHSKNEMLGKTLDVCRLESKLGQGGMGTVYMAHHMTLQKKVAIKILPPELAMNQKILDRFFREAQSAAKLEHPNIVQVHDVRTSDTGAYIVMQYVEGTTLTKKILEGKLSLTEKLNLLLQVAEGLTFAHKRGIIHRDIKSENILVSKYGEAKIADFGLAKINDEFGSQLTSHGQIMGTPDYMPPEIAKGGSADARSDQYSLGILFYFTLTERLPFKASNIPNLLMKHIHEIPPAPKTLNEEISPSLNYIVVKMMQKEPEQRYPILDELLQDLKWILMGQALPPEKINSLLPAEEIVNPLEATSKPTKKLPTLLAKSVPVKSPTASVTPSPSALAKPSSPQIKPSTHSRMTPVPKEKPTESNKNLSSVATPSKIATPTKTPSSSKLDLARSAPKTAQQKAVSVNPTRKNVQSSGVRNAVASPQHHRKGSGKKQNSALPLYFGVAVVALILIVGGVIFKNKKKQTDKIDHSNNQTKTDPTPDPNKVDWDKVSAQEKQAAQLVGATLGLLVNEKSYKFKKKQYEALLEKVAGTSQVVKVEIAIAKLKEVHLEEAKKIFEKAKKESDKLIEQALSRREWDMNTESKLNNAENALSDLTEEYEETEYWNLKQQELARIEDARKKLKNSNPGERPFVSRPNEPPVLEGVFFEDNGEKTGRLYMLEGKWKTIDGVIMNEVILTSRSFLEVGSRLHRDFQMQFDIKIDQGLAKTCLLAGPVKEHHHFSSHFFDLKMGEWYPVKIEFRNNKFVIEANGKRDEMDATLGNFSTSGVIRFECDRDTLLHLKNIRLKDLK